MDIQTLEKINSTVLKERRNGIGSRMSYKHCVSASRYGRPVRSCA